MEYEILYYYVDSDESKKFYTIEEAKAYAKKLAEEVVKEVKFGERIRAVRKNAKCNQKEFCSLLNIPQSTLSAYETDRMQPTVATLINISTKFNVSMDWLCSVDKRSPCVCFKARVTD